MSKFATSHQTAGEIRRRIESGGERLWRMDDFRDLPFAAVAQTLSRLQRAGAIERLSKGTYYRTRQTPFGPSRPNPSAIQQLAAKHAIMFPAGAAAANLLGFTTQLSGRKELATIAASLPRCLIGQDTVIYTRRPKAWSNLPAEDAALLDFLRRGGPSELSPEATIERTLRLLGEPGRFRRLATAAATEPPRIRAMLGALGQHLNHDSAMLTRLRASLNPLSRFDFGSLAGLPTARLWQAKEPRRLEAA